MNMVSSRPLKAPKAMFGKQNIANSVHTDNTPLCELHTQFKHQKAAIRRYWGLVRFSQIYNDKESY